MVDADDGADGGESDGERLLLYNRIGFCRLVSRRAVLRSLLRRSERRYTIPTKEQSTYTTIICKYTHTFDNHSHRGGVPRLELAPIVTPLIRRTTNDHSTKPPRAINDDPQHDRQSVKLSARASSRLSKTGDNCLS